MSRKRVLWDVRISQVNVGLREEFHRPARSGNGVFRDYEQWKLHPLP